MIAALFGVGVLTGGDEADEEAPVPGAQDVERVARRLERVRGLRFKRLPPVRTISGDEARREGLAESDRQYPAEKRAVDEKVLKLLGLLPQDADLRELTAKIFGEEVAGFYDDRAGRMTLVAGSAGGAERDITLAHELTHALEDQHFGIRDSAGLDDARTAYTALVEGTATVAMADYVARYLTRGAVSRRTFLDQLSLVDLFESSSGLPPYIQRSLLFSYTAGARFVDAIGTWGPANAALRGRGPVSTEQILHPRKFESRERPLYVAPGPAPGAGWARAKAGTFGEVDTAELIRTADSPVRAARAAAGWGGGRYAVWRRKGDVALRIAWRWDTPRDAAEFVAALPRYVTRGLDGRSAGPGVWRAPDRGFVAVAPGAEVRLAVAPTRRLASALAR